MVVQKGMPTEISAEIVLGCLLTIDTIGYLRISPVMNLGSASVRISTKCDISSWATAQLALPWFQPVMFWTVLDWIALRFCNALNFLRRLASRPWSAMMRSSLPKFRVQRRWRSYAWWNLRILQLGQWHLRTPLYFATALFTFSSVRAMSPTLHIPILSTSIRPLLFNIYLIWSSIF